MEDIIIYNKTTYKHTGIRFYYISKEGEVISNFKGKIKILKTFLSPDGYKRIALKCEAGKERKYLIHRLVFKVYGDEPLREDMVIDHIDANRLNNNIDNLRQCTQKENIKNALNHNFGNNNSKSICVLDKENNKILFFDSVKDLISYVGVPISNGSLSRLKKHSKFKNRFVIKHIEKGQQTIESIA